jgi:spoIIIJ-associated protein
VTDLPQTQAYTEPSTDAASAAEKTDTPEQALSYLQKILDLAQLDATASIGRVTEEELTLDLSGPDASLLIGRHGQTLDSLQYLLLVIVSAGRPSPPSSRMTVDVEGYRQRRIETLTRYAQSLAAQVRETHEEAVLEPLNPLERRIVHTALVDDPYVETYSEGFGQDRHIVISPRKPGMGSQSAERDSEDNK